MCVFLESEEISPKWEKSVKCRFESCWVCFSPPARWGLLDFMSDVQLLLLPPPHRISSASSWSQWASPDLHCQLSIAGGLAAPQPARVWAVGLAGPSTGEGRRAWASPDLQPARVGALWASPDRNWRESERCEPRRTSTGEIRSTVGLAGPQPARFGALWASPGLNRRESARRGPRRSSTGPLTYEKELGPFIDDLPIKNGQILETAMFWTSPCDQGAPPWHNPLLPSRAAWSPARTLSCWGPTERASAGKNPWGV